MRKCYFSGQRHRDFTPHVIPLQLDTSSRMWPTKQTPGKWDMSPKCHQTTGEPTTQGIILNMFLVEYMTPGGETCNSRMGYHWIKKKCADLRQCRAGSGMSWVCFFKEVQNSVFHCVPTFIEKMASRNCSCACQFHDDIPPQMVILFKRNPSFPGQFGMLDKQLTITRLVSSSQFIFQPSSSKNMMASATHAG